jgi:S1-C subfamily serine protease
MVQKTAEGVGMQISDSGQVVRVSTEAASAAGAAAGMQICAVNGHAVTSKDDIVRAMATIQVGQTVKFTVHVNEQQDCRGGEGEGEAAIASVP